MRNPTATWRLSVSLPGRRAADARYVVEIQDASTPWPVRLGFLLLRDDETGAVERRLVSIELGADRVDASDEPPSPLPLDAAEHLARDIPFFAAIAERALLIDLPGAREQARSLAAPGRARVRRALDDVFLRLVADQAEQLAAAGLPAVTELARRHYVNKATASRWLKAARERGLTV